MDTTVRLQIKVTGKDGFKEVEVSADDLRKAIGNVREDAERLSNSLINSNQMAQAFEQVSSAVQGLQSVMRGLTDAYAVQSAAEARLEQVMRNTMGAVDADIQSIKDLTAAQQKLGIVGDEVQLSGAQELATYLSKKESLETIIPVMNDMIAQQYGYNASAESAVQIASMLGKVLDGQTGALSRYGYTFTDAQEAVLKFGTEEERVATLAEVVESSVGGMNEAMASTPYGKIVQANNAFGDLKETIGKIVTPAMNVVDNVARITIAISGLGKGIATIRSLSVTIKTMTAGIKTATVAQHGLNTAMKANVFIAVASAVAALVAVVVKLAKASRDAGKATEELNEASEAYKGAVGQAKAEIDTEIAALKRLIDTNTDATEAIRKLNEKYGEIFGNHQTAAEWYDTLTKKSETYCRQLGYEAKAKSLAAAIGAKIVERDENKAKLDPNADYQKDQVGRYYDANKGGRYHIPVSAEIRDALDNITRLDAEIETMTAEMNNAFTEAANAADELTKKVGATSDAITWQEMSYNDLGKAIQEQKKKVGDFANAESNEAQAEMALLQAMIKHYNQLGQALGLASSQVKTIGGDENQSKYEAPDVEILPLKPAPAYVELPPDTLARFDMEIKDLQKRRLNATKEQLPAIDAEIARVKKLRDEFEGVQEEVSDTAAQVIEMPNFSDAWNGIKGVGNSIRGITSALTESEDAWSTVTGLVDSFIGLFQSFQSIVDIINQISAATESMAAAKAAASAQIAEANAVEATTNTAVAATGAASAMANIPWIGPALAIAAVAAVLASLTGLPKFANGGIIYGPTMGLMGEYAGASNNPEVVAPLNKLRGILGNNGGGEVKFRIEGRELVGILNKQNNIYRRSE